VTTSRRLAAILLGLALVAGPVAATIFGSETSVEAGMTSPSTAEAAAGSVVVRNDRRLAPSSGGAVKVRAGSGGSPTLSAPVQLDDGGAVVGGLASYVGRSYGSRYLALPGGPGIRVSICAKGRCVRRTSTDAGPDLERQRAGLVADLSWADFHYLCRCVPRLVGHIVVSVQYDELPATDTAP
jgi:hypothetical protein